MLSPQSLPGAVSSETENGLLSFNDSMAISDQWQITPIVRIGANKGYLIFLFILRSPQIPLCFLFPFSPAAFSQPPGKIMELPAILG